MQNMRACARKQMFHQYSILHYDWIDFEKKKKSKSKFNVHVHAMSNNFFSILLLLLLLFSIAQLLSVRNKRVNNYSVYHSASNAILSRSMHAQTHTRNHKFWLVFNSIWYVLLVTITTEIQIHSFALCQLLRITFCRLLWSLLFFLSIKNVKHNLWIWHINLKLQGFMTQPRILSKITSQSASNR